jgi:hypothetical protein
VEGTRRRLRRYSLGRCSERLLISCSAIRDCGVIAGVRGLAVTVIVPASRLSAPSTDAHVRASLGMEIGSKAKSRIGGVSHGCDA